MEPTQNTRTRSREGYRYAVLTSLVFVAVYLLNYAVPLPESETGYNSRLVFWAFYTLAAAALFYIVRLHRFLPKAAAAAASLGLVAGISRFADTNLETGLIIGGTVCIVFYGASLMCEEYRIPDRVFGMGLPKALRSVLFGAAVGLPFAVGNLWYFFMQGSAHPQNFFLSALRALNPGITEEVLFRFFLFALCTHLLKGKVSERFYRIYTGVFLVVPHALLHLPDVFLQQGVGNALVMGLMMSVLFGLPMAVLFVKKNLQTAVAFHWIIDFLRAFFGYY